MASVKELRNGMRVVGKYPPFKDAEGEITRSVLVPGGPGSKIQVTFDDPLLGTVEILPKGVELIGRVSVANAASSTTASATTVVGNVIISDMRIESLDDPALDDFRPNINPANYVSRTLAGGKTDLEVMEAYFNRRDENDGYPVSVALVGDTQSGKTYLIQVQAFRIAKLLGLQKPLPLFLLAGSSAITDHDLFGQYRPIIVNGQERLVWMEGIVALAARLGGILYLDEVNAMSGSVTAAIHPLLDNRHQFVNIRKPVWKGTVEVDPITGVETHHGAYRPETVVANKNLWIMASWNPGYAGMAKTNEAFANRFKLLEWGYDEEVEKKLIKSPAVRLLGQALRNARAQRSITTPVGTRALQLLEGDLVHLGVDYSLWAFMGQFVSSQEKIVVNEIIKDRGIAIMMKDEFEPDVPASTVDLTSLIGDNEPY
jgi:MoxR-like ATPase